MSSRDELNATLMKKRVHAPRMVVEYAVQRTHIDTRSLGHGEGVVRGCDGQDSSMCSFFYVAQVFFFFSITYV